MGENVMRGLLRSVCVFVVTAFLLIGWLFAGALIPRSAIEKNAAASAEFLAADPAVFHYQVPNAPASIRDQYADANLLNIAYYFDSQKPLDSVIWDRYYWGENLTANLSFLEAVKKNPPANKEYLRYWHGSLAIVRPLLVFLSIDRIYLLHAVVLIVLCAALMRLLLKNKYRTEAISLLISLVMVNVWFVPLCLEYYWMFLVMFISSIIAVKFAAGESFRTEENGWKPGAGYLFLITGIVAAFLDFLTVEIITALIPLLLILSIGRRKGIAVPGMTIVKWLAQWGIGFAGMWSLKWLLASVYIGESVVPYLKDNTMLHLGLQSHISRPALILRGWLRNIFALAPFEYGIYGGIALFLFIVCFIAVPVFKNEVRLRSKFDRFRIRRYLIIGAIPYLRYMALPTHTSHHYFFMHRAQAVTILALCFVVRELVEKTPLNGARHH